MTKRQRWRMRHMWGMDKDKKFIAHGNLIFCVSSILLRFKPPGNKARLACQCWVESGTIRGQGCPSDVKEGLSPALYFYGSLGLLKWLYQDQWKSGKLDKRKLMFDILTHLCLKLFLKKKTKIHMCTTSIHTHVCTLTYMHMYIST